MSVGGAENTGPQLGERSRCEVQHCRLQVQKGQLGTAATLLALKGQAHTGQAQWVLEVMNQIE